MLKSIKWDKYLTPNVLFWIALLLQLIIIVYFGSKKINLFGDEIWSFNLANRYFEPFVGDASRYFYTWLSADFWNQTITVVPEHAFSYNSVFYNQSQDVHPPFYYLIIHTICSLFPEKFSIWYGIIPNMIFFVLTQNILYKAAKKFFGDKWLALAVCLVYGFSWGTINNVVYIRMYAMMSFWAVLSYILHLDLIESFDRKKYLLVLFISLAGILTQYYFLIFEFFVSLGFCFYLILNKQYKLTAKYAVGFIAVLGAVIAIFPPIIAQILGKVGNQGQAAFQNLATSHFSERVGVFGHIISKDIFGAHIKWVVIILFMIFLIKLASSFCQLTIRKVGGWKN